jgi:hypothetical protein
MILEAEKHAPDLRLFLWLARVTALLIAGLSLLWVAGYTASPAGFDPTTMETFEVGLFPFGMCLGYLIALRWHLVGGVLSLGCLAMFLGARQDILYVVFFGPLSLPGVFFYFYGMHQLDQRRELKSGQVT